MIIVQGTVSSRCDHCAGGSAAVDVIIVQGTVSSRCVIIVQGTVSSRCVIIVQGTVSSRCVIEDIAGCDHCAVDSAAVDV